jgi:hypothetical protein
MNGDLLLKRRWGGFSELTTHAEPRLSLQYPLSQSTIGSNSTDNRYNTIQLKKLGKELILPRPFSPGSGVL